MKINDPKLTDEKRRYGRDHLFRLRYGISASEYEEMFFAQGEKCAICGRIEINGNLLSVDHDHCSGKVRGLLCGKCNTGLGFFRDDIKIVRAAERIGMNIFSKASIDFMALNPSLKPQPHQSNHGKVKIKKRGRMNRVEQEYAMILEAQKRAGEILRYEFEGITLRFAGVKYTPDFVVISANSVLSHALRYIEVKGPWIKGNRERAIERYRHAKTYWPEFTFEMHQKTKAGWKQII